jgi:hypothetical protein
MATGILGTTQATASYASAYRVPPGYYSVFNVSFTNTSTSAVTISMAISTSSSSPQTNEVFEVLTTVIPNGVFERTGLVADAGKYVLVKASTTSVVNVNVYGIETSTA